MKALLARYLSPVMMVLLVLGMLWGSYQRFQVQKIHLERTEELLLQQKKVVDAFEQEFDKLQQRVSSLLALQAGVRADLVTRQNEIKRLQSDVKEIREWATVDLPSDISRLRERPTISGADAYRKFMPQIGAVRTDGE